jgi:hypothetical protein
MAKPKEKKRKLVKSPNGTMHAVHHTIKCRTECGKPIGDDWEKAEADFYPNFCASCKRILK